MYVYMYSKYVFIFMYVYIKNYLSFMYMYMFLIRKESRVLHLRNNTLLPAAWKLSGIETLGEEFSFSQEQGIVQPKSEFPLNVHFRALKILSSLSKKAFKIEVIYGNCICILINIYLHVYVHVSLFDHYKSLMSQIIFSSFNFILFLFFLSFIYCICKLYIVHVHVFVLFFHFFPPLYFTFISFISLSLSFYFSFPPDIRCSADNRTHACGECYITS